MEYEWLDLKANEVNQSTTVFEYVSNRWKCYCGTPSMETTWNKGPFVGKDQTDQTQEKSNKQEVGYCWANL